MNKDPPLPRTCIAKDCAAPATLLHRDRPYCGKHALELLEKEGHVETPGDFMKSAAAPERIEVVESGDLKADSPA